jgi:hypothetical protein
MQRQERIARQMVVKYGMTTARIKAGSRAARALYIAPAIERRTITESDVFRWTFWHCVSASLNKLERTAH